MTNTVINTGSNNADWIYSLSQLSIILVSTGNINVYANNQAILESGYVARGLSFPKFVSYFIH